MDEIELLENIDPKKNIQPINVTPTKAVQYSIFKTYSTYEKQSTYKHHSTNKKHSTHGKIYSMQGIEHMKIIQVIKNI